MTYEEGVTFLREILDDQNAKFRDGQWEAIQALTVNRNKLLVVQRTGWGKSLVYWFATRIFRNQGYGLTLVVSPLLALMRNQVDAANKYGIRAKTINSSISREEYELIRQDVVNDSAVDALLISPERFANEDFVDHVLTPIADQIGMLVIDEAHCISDWGHDFRPDYRRISRILNNLPDNVPVLATTATANDRVIKDIKAQIGDKLVIQRGSLLRESIKLQCMNLPSRAERLSWLASLIPQFKNSGVVYTLTTSDNCSSWLVKKMV